MLVSPKLRVVGTLAVAWLLTVASGRAQDLSLTGGARDDSAPAKTPTPPDEHKRGVYCGVKPGGAAPRGTDAKPGQRPPEITWPGFQMQPDGGSRVFIQATSPLDTQAAASDGKIVVDLGDARVTGANRYPLFTRYFNTPVLRIEIKRAHKRTTLELTMRAQVQPRISTEQAPSGFFFLYLDFPPGNYLGPSPANVGAAPPAPDTLDSPPAPSPPAPSASAGASAHASAAMSASTDSEVPPGMAKPNATGKAKGSFRFGSH